MIGTVRRFDPMSLEEGPWFTQAGSPSSVLFSFVYDMHTRSIKPICTIITHSTRRFCICSFFPLNCCLVRQSPNHPCLKEPVVGFLQWLHPKANDVPNVCANGHKLCLLIYLNVVHACLLELRSGTHCQRTCVSVFTLIALQLLVLVVEISRRLVHSCFDPHGWIPLSCTYNKHPVGIKSSSCVIPPWSCTALFYLSLILLQDLQ